MCSRRPLRQYLRLDDNHVELVRADQCDRWPCGYGGTEQTSTQAVRTLAASVAATPTRAATAQAPEMGAFSAESSMTMDLAQIGPSTVSGTSRAVHHPRLTMRQHESIRTAAFIVRYWQPARTEQSECIGDLVMTVRTIKPPRAYDLPSSHTHDRRQDREIERPRPPQVRCPDLGASSDQPAAVRFPGAPGGVSWR